MVTIGILGGMGPSSTAPFLDMVYAECRAQYDASRDEDYPHILLYSLPTPYGEGGVIDQEAMSLAITAGIRRLEAAGVDYVAVPCSTSHRYFSEIRERVRVPLIDMVEATVREATVYGGHVGVIATPPTHEWGGYYSRLRECGLTPVHANATQPLVDHILARLTEGVSPSLLAEDWETVVRLYKAAGAERLIVGCTDLSVMVDSRSASQFIDAARILARTVVQEYLECSRNSDLLRN